MLKYVWKSAAEPLSVTNNDASKLRKDRLTDEETTEEPVMAGSGLGFPASLTHWFFKT